MLRLKARNLRQQRGFLLIEAMFSASIMAVLLAGILNLIGGSQAKVAQARNYGRANALAQQKAQELLGEEHLATGSNSEASPPYGYEISWNVSKASVPLAGVKDDNTLHEILVTVKYTSEGSVTQNVTYKILKRKKRYN